MYMYILTQLPHLKSELIKPPLELVVDVLANISQATSIFPWHFLSASLPSCALNPISTSFAILASSPMPEYASGWDDGAATTTRTKVLILCGIRCVEKYHGSGVYAYMYMYIHIYIVVK